MTQSPDASDWSTRLALRVAAEVRRHRLARKMSAQQLSDRCAELGMPIQRSVLANLESRRRSTVTVAEVLVLARALDVPPGVLIFPVGFENRTEVLPGEMQQPLDGLDWFAGLRFIDEASWEEYENSPLLLFRQHQQEISLLEDIVERVDHARRNVARLEQQAEESTWRHEDRARALDVAVVNLAEARANIYVADQRGDEERVQELTAIISELSETRDVLLKETAQEEVYVVDLKYAKNQLRYDEQAARRQAKKVSELRHKMRAAGLALPPLDPGIRTLVPQDSDGPVE